MQPSTRPRPSAIDRPLQKTKGDVSILLVAVIISV